MRWSRSYLVSSLAFFAHCGHHSGSAQFVSSVPRRRLFPGGPAASMMNNRRAAICGAECFRKISMEISARWGRKRNLRARVCAPLSTAEGARARDKRGCVLRCKLVWPRAPSLRSPYLSSLFASFSLLLLYCDYFIYLFFFSLCRFFAWLWPAGCVRSAVPVFLCMSLVFLSLTRACSAYK